MWRFHKAISLSVALLTLPQTLNFQLAGLNYIHYTPKHSFQFFAAGPGPGSDEGSFKDFKGQRHKIFCFRFFSRSSSPKPLNIALGSFPMFFEESLRFSQVKVHRRCQRHWWQILQLVVPLLLLIPVANSPLVSTIRYRR
jgi:hypothetical protein